MERGPGQAYQVVKWLEAFEKMASTLYLSSEHVCFSTVSTVRMALLQVFLKPGRSGELVGTYRAVERELSMCNQKVEIVKVEGDKKPITHGAGPPSISTVHTIIVLPTTISASISVAGVRSPKMRAHCHWGAKTSVAPVAQECLNSNLLRGCFVNTHICVKCWFTLFM